MTAQHRSLNLFAVTAVLIAMLSGSALAQAPAAAEGDGTRAVRIIEGAPGQPAEPPGSLAAPTSPPPVATLDVRATSIRAENEAGLALSIEPDVELALGARVFVRVATKKAGYLILVDVDPTGKLTQIYPNRYTLEHRDNQESLNLIKTGQTVTLPNRDNPYAGFEFVTAPPAGIAMLVAILSDRPVHLLDLPDVGPPGAGQATFDQISEVARRLRIAHQDGSIAPEGPRWSFDAKLYVVK